MPGLYDCLFYFFMLDLNNDIVYSRLADTLVLDVLVQTDILFEDDYLLAINKKPGRLVQGDRSGAKPLSELARAYLDRSLPATAPHYVGVVHRLDRDVSGIVLLAKTPAVCGRLNAQFEVQQIKKSYWALVDKAPPQTSGQVIHYLKKK
jgi:23S rRNA pseudouridine1911/1915/1917 synthase